MKKRILFIINPISGSKKGPAISKAISESNIYESFNAEITFTERRGHATDLASAAAKSGVEVVVAVGGDGTVNEVAKGLLGSNTALGIIPAGSGNGLARHMNYPSDAVKAIQKIKKGSSGKIDTMDINGRLSINVSGFGFDGYVAWLFDQSGRRGLSGYTRIALKEYAHYPAVDFEMNLDEKPVSGSAHMVVLANASQFGNAAVIAPMADLNDGLMDVIVVKKPPFYLMPRLLYRLFTGTLKSDDYNTMYQCKSLQISSKQPVHLHIDGEPNPPVTSVNCTIKPQSLNVWG